MNPETITIAGDMTVTVRYVPQPKQTSSKTERENFRVAIYSAEGKRAWISPVVSGEQAARHMAAQHIRTMRENAHNLFDPTLEVHQLENYHDKTQPLYQSALYSPERKIIWVSKVMSSYEAARRLAEAHLELLREGVRVQLERIFR